MLLKNQLLKKFFLAVSIALCIAFCVFFFSISLGADRPLLLRIIMAPFVVPFLISKPFWGLFGDNEYEAIYKIMTFSLIFYFIFASTFIVIWNKFGKKKFIILSLFYLLVFSILPLALFMKDTNQSYNQFFIFKDGNFKMPVWIRGNVDSNIILFHLHGGPADNSYEDSAHFSFRELEKKYLIIYWDQPGSGSSTAIKRFKNISINQITDSLDNLLEIVLKKYPDKKLILHGHSFGGEVGTKYLTEYDYKDKVCGWIEVAGSHNETDNWNYSLKYFQDRAYFRLKNGNFDSIEEKKFWEDGLKFTEDHIGKEFLPWNKTIFWDYYVGQSGGYYYENSKQTVPSLLLIPHYWVGRPSFFLSRININRSKKVFNDALVTDYNSKMGKISIPTLFLYGKHDGSTNYQTAIDAFNSIGTSSEKKEIYLFEKSGHAPQREEPEKYLESVFRFIQFNFAE